MPKCPMDKEYLIFDLQKGLENERRALESCQRLSEMIESEEDRSVIDKIAEDEVRHIRMVERLIKITENHYTKES